MFGANLFRKKLYVLTQKLKFWKRKLYFYLKPCERESFWEWVVYPKVNSRHEFKKYLWSSMLYCLKTHCCATTTVHTVSIVFLTNYIILYFVVLRLHGFPRNRSYILVSITLVMVIPELPIWRQIYSHTLAC